MLPEAKDGDLALTRGLTATQIAVTRVGCNTDDATSNAHELVVLQAYVVFANGTHAGGD